MRSRLSVGFLIVLIAAALSGEVSAQDSTRVIRPIIFDAIPGGTLLEEINIDGLDRAVLYSGRRHPRT